MLAVARCTAISIRAPPVSVETRANRLGFSSATALEHLDIRGLFSFAARRHIKGNFLILGKRFKAH